LTPRQKHLLAAAFVFMATSFSISCAPSYPYLVLNEDCRCKKYVHRDSKLNIEIHVTASYRVAGAITSKIEITFLNGATDTLSLKQGFIKAGSRNVRYASNDKFQPLPFVEVPPGEQYTMTLEGRDVDESSDPWLKIAGERVTIEVRRLLVDGREVSPIIFTLMPVNPQFSM
jgi:hypothetical protein